MKKNCFIKIKLPTQCCKMAAKCYNSLDTNFMLRSKVHAAAFYGQTQIVMDILEDSSDKNPKNDKLITPLHLAAERGFVSICEYIIGGIDDKYPKDYTRRTPLHFAAVCGHLRVCELILNNTESTVDIIIQDLRSNIKDKTGKTIFFKLSSRYVTKYYC